jgi:hypothetical protein
LSDARTLETASYGGCYGAVTEGYGGCYSGSSAEIQLYVTRMTNGARMGPAYLPAEWRQKADRLRRYSASAANAWDDAATELEAALAKWESELLSIRQAAVESGYSEDHLRTLVRDGALPDSRPNGSRGEMRIRRCDLPRKPGLARGLFQREDDFASRVAAHRKEATHG